jgi:hypothetical protein
MKNHCPKCQRDYHEALMDCPCCNVRLVDRPLESARVSNVPMPRLVMIEWLDSHHGSGWTTDTIVAKPLLCRSVGFLVAESESAKVLSANITDEENSQHCGDITIPQCCIQRITTLSELPSPNGQSEASSESLACKLECCSDASKVVSCGARSHRLGYLCSRESGHSGQHVACAGLDHAIECWPNNSASESFTHPVVRPPTASELLSLCQSLRLEK